MPPAIFHSILNQQSILVQPDNARIYTLTGVDDAKTIPLQSIANLHLGHER